MNVLTDRHHAGLYRSLQLLADRLGWTLYTPRGLGWFNEGYWQFGLSTYGDDRLARQFLLQTGPDEEFPNVPVNYVTLLEASVMNWDIVIASVPDNQPGFRHFADESGATYVVQCGNTGQYIDWTLDPIVLNSSEMPLLGRGVTYHQELDPVFTLGQREAGTFQPPHPDTVRSFVHLMHETHAFTAWNGLRSLLPEFTFQRYGHAPDAYDPSYATNLKPISRIFDAMYLSGFGFHDKPVGDGFGHVIHGWAAVGRPLIGHASHYAGKLAEGLWRDGETCIDLDLHSLPETAELLREIVANPARHAAMCGAIRAEYDRIDYAAEAQMIREVLA